MTLLALSSASIGNCKTNDSEYLTLKIKVKNVDYLAGNWLEDFFCEHASARNQNGSWTL